MRLARLDLKRMATPPATPPGPAHRATLLLVKWPARPHRSSTRCPAHTTALLFLHIVQ